MEERVVTISVKLRAHGVALLGAVEDQPSDAVVFLFNLDCLVFIHHWNPPFVIFGPRSGRTLCRMDIALVAGVACLAEEFLDPSPKPYLMRAELRADPVYQRTIDVKITQSSHTLHHLRATFVLSCIDILKSIEIRLKRQFHPFHPLGP